VANRKRRTAQKQLRSAQLVRSRAKKASQGEANEANR
jgi:hypothetical protein